MRLAGGRTAAWLDAGLRLAATGRPQPMVGGALLRLAGERPAMPPPAFVADLAALALGGRLVRRSIDDAGLRAAVARAEDRLLAGLAGDPRLLEAGDALSRLPEAERPAGLALLAGLVLDRLGAAGEEVEIAVLRRALAGATPPAPDTEVVAALTDGHAALAAAALRAPRPLVRASDAGLVAHAAVLAPLGARVRLAALVDRTESLAQEALRLPRPRRRRQGRAPVAGPGGVAVGGYREIVPGSRLEGLVASELALLDEPDLFLARFAEGQLLAYARDDGLDRRAEVTVTVGVDDDDLDGLAVAGALHRVLAGQRGKLAARLAVVLRGGDVAALAAPYFAAIAPAGPPVHIMRSWPERPGEVSRALGGEEPRAALAALVGAILAA